MTTVLHHVGADTVAPVRDEFPGVRFVAVDGDAPLPADLRGEVLLTSAIGAPNLGEVLERGVRWVHTIGTGVDRFPLGELRPGQVLTCSRGASAVPIAEWTLAVMLAFAKRLPDTWIHEPPARWYRAELGALCGHTVAILGLGSIGTETARRALAFGMRVVALRRTLRPSPLEGVEVVDRAERAVAGAHHVVIAAAATSETRHLVDADLLAAMEPGVHLVNVARGSLVDQDALRVALDEGRVAMASLDVVEPEPLPDGHWLYEHPRVRLSPHVSWSMPDAFLPLVDTFRRNLHHWLVGEPLEGVVDVELGY